MSVWTELATREGALLAILLALGAGPAALLPARFDAAARIALAPVLGFCLGTCVATTVLWFVPAETSHPMLVPLALGSVAFAAWRTLRSAAHAWPSLRDAAQLLVVCLLVTGPLSFVLHERHTIGPVSYYFTDVDNYVAQQQAAATTSLREAEERHERRRATGERAGDLTQAVYGFFADFKANLDAAPLHANVDALLGMSAVDNWASFAIVLLLMGALGAYAAVRTIAARPTWMAVVAGGLFGGPLFLELWFDTHQAAIIALGLLVPAVLLGAEALREPRPANLVLLALVLACFIGTYPLFVPPLVVLGLVALAWHVAAARRAGRGAGAVRSLLGPVLALAALTAAFNVVAVARTVGYYARFLEGGFPYPRVSYRLPPEVLPGWLLQTREFWFLTPLGTDLEAIVLGILIPLALSAFIVVAARRHRFALALLGLAAVCAVAAYGAYASADACTYCGQRYLLALAPILIVTLGLGLHEALRRPSRAWRAAGVVGVLLAVAAVGQRTRVELDRFADASFFLDTATRSALDALPDDDRPLHVEGYWASVLAQPEQPLAYHLANERAPGRVSLTLGSNVYNGLAYLNFGRVLPPGPEFKADYRYVLTRFPGVATDRRLLARRGGMALMERTRPLDVTPYAGLSIQLARVDGSGTPWVGPAPVLGFYVVGDAGGAPVWVRLTFRTATRVGVPRQRGVRARVRADSVTACVRATGRAPIRDAKLTLPVPGPSTVVLTEMRAVSGRCRA